MKIFLAFIFGFALVIDVAFGAAANTVDLIWEGETSIPPFYAGRPLPSPGNLVRVVAISNVVESGRRLTANQLIFRWVKDFNPIQSASGMGKNVLEYRADSNGASSIISVEVLTNQGERLAEARATITPIKPKLVLYNVRPLTSPSRARALTGITPIDSSETTLIAQPFFFSPLDLANRRLTLDWRINGERVPSQREDGRFFAVAAPDQGSGEVKLSVTARSESSPSQPVVAAVANLSFGRPNFNF